MSSDKKNISILILVLLCSFFGFVHLQADASENTINDIIGNWKGKGTIFGMNSYYSMEWKHALDDKFIHLEFQNVWLDSNKNEIVFSAQAFYQPANGQNTFSGSWYDSRGKSLTLNGELNDSVFTVHWVDPGVEEGRTEYKIVSATEIEAADYVLKNDEWIKFGAALYTKTETDTSTEKVGKVTGIGGVFFRTNNRQDVMEWYKTNLGVDSEEYGKAFLWKDYDDITQTGYTVWGPFGKGTTYFGDMEQMYMVNYRIDDLEALMKKLTANGVEIVGEMQEFPNGKFAWIKDIEGVRIELWEPINSDDDPYLK